MSRNNLLLKTIIFVLIFGMFAKYCDSQILHGNEDHKAPDAQRRDISNAFFALRSCHQVMHSNTGEFFSPEYLCSNPPLWCNWTIHMDPGKRVHLYLEDLTPADTCHLKQDQIHVDEPTGYFGGHKVLQKCWHEATFTSVSNTLYVVLLIGGYPDAPYRGFYGRYQVFGPPIVYDPLGVAEQDEALPVEPTSVEQPHAERSDAHLPPTVDGERMEGVSLERPPLTPPAYHDHTYDDYDQPSETSVELPRDKEEELQAYPSQVDIYNMSHFLVSTEGNLRSGREASQAQSEHPDKDVPFTHPQHNGPDSTPSLPSPTSVQWNSPPQEHMASTIASTPTPPVEGPVEGPALAGDYVTVLQKSSGPQPPDVISADAEDTPLYPYPRIVEPHPHHRENGHMINRTEFPHLPGDHMFEVAVELNFSHNIAGPWGNVARSLLMSLKALIIEQLEPLHMPTSLSSKRIKRLSAGVLYILWLHIGEKPGGPQMHNAFHSVLQNLIETTILHEEGSLKAAIVSVSTADVNECGTQLVLCDINADCVNRYGSYSCHCRPGFQDMSRLGSGGTLCVDVKASGCRSGSSADLTKGVYVVFFLLSSLILVLLITVGVMYCRHHRGAFLVRCRSDSLASGPNFKDNRSVNGDSEVPPPPIRRPKEGWSHPKECCPAVDLPLLRFSPVRPLDGYIEPDERGKM